MKYTQYQKIIMGKSKGSRITITLEGTCKTHELPGKKNGICRYTTRKNKKNTPNRLELKKFCSYCNKHTLFKEIK